MFRTRDMPEDSVLGDVSTESRCLQVTRSFCDGGGVHAARQAEAQHLFTTSQLNRILKDRGALRACPFTVPAVP